MSHSFGNPASADGEVNVVHTLTMGSKVSKLVSSVAGAGCLVQLVVLTIIVTLGAFAAEYVLETWAGVFGSTIDVPMPHIATFVIGGLFSQALIPLAVLTWLLSVIGVIG